MRTRTTERPRHLEVEPGSGLGVLLAAILGAAMITGSLIFVVTARTAELKAGYALHALHQQRARLARQRSELRLEIAALTRPERLAGIAPKLGLAPPERAQVLPPREAVVVEKQEAAQ